MYESQTYEVILARILAAVPDSIDKREGSIIYDALAPAAVELTQSYIEMDVVLNESFADTASREYLIKRASEKELRPSAATYAICRGEFNIDISVGDRFSCGDYNYAATERISSGVWKLTCETAGSTPNSKLGILIPIDYIDGLETAELTEILMSGEDEEETEDFRTRYFSLVRTPTTSGNANHYRQWALEVPGVGDAKIYPLWDGPGTVKVVIVDNDKQPASSTLIEVTADHIEELRPIGAEVNVVSGIGKQINPTAKVILASGYSLQTIISALSQAVTGYFKSIAFSIPYISIAKIGTILLSTDGVIDYSDLQLNGTTSNIVLTEEEIPILGTVNLEV